jgi:hypothetical protein
VSDTGVVDPIRVPASVDAFVRRMPRLAQVFVVLSVLDVIGRWLGVVEPGLYLTTEYPQSFVTAFLPHDALILLPAAIVLRRPDAEAATPWVLRGALIVALVELLSSPTRAIVSGMVGPQDGDVVLWLVVVATVLSALGWLALGRGLSTLNPSAPPAPVAGLANLAALLVAATIVLSLIGLAFSPTNVANPAGSGIPVTNYLAGWFGVLAWAYLLRSVLRGLDDPSRSLTVTRVAAVGALLSSTMTFFIALLGLIFSLDIQIAVRVGNDPGILASLAGDTVGITLIVIAIALGFADPLRPMAKDWDKATAG